MSKLTLNSEQNIQTIKEATKKLYENEIYLAQLCVAQAILESNLENKPSLLALEYCNLFGMKPGIIRTGTAIPGTIYLDTNEYIQGKGMVKVKQPFLSNLNIEDSLEQYKELFEKLDRYANLFQANSFEEIANLVHEDGYATDPNYPTELKAVYDRNNLENL